MFDLNDYLKKLIAACQAAFGDRLLYVGLQGSYMRGEATERSDIDVMIVLDRFSVRDMDIYRQALESAGERERACGFICGREELARWNPLGLIVMALGVALSALSGRLSQGHEGRKLALKLIGLLIVAAGALITMKIIG